MYVIKQLSDLALYSALLSCASDCTFHPSSPLAYSSWLSIFLFTTEKESSEAQELSSVPHLETCHFKVLKCSSHGVCAHIDVHQSDGKNGAEKPL